MKNKRTFARIVLAIVLILVCVMSFAACDGVAIKSISVTTLPTKVVYQIGEKFDPTGGKLTAVLADDKMLVVDIDSAMCGTVDTSVAGKVEVKVGYLEKFATFEITVLPSSVVVTEVKSISVTTLPTKVEYAVGEAFSAVGGKITVTYIDNSVRVIDIDSAMCGTVNTSVEGKVTVTVTCQTKTATFEITVLPSSVVVTEVKSISVTTLPTKGEYTVGEAFSALGGKITVTYADNTTEIIDLTDVMCGTVDTATAGTVTVTATYETKTATFDITVGKIAPIIATAPTASVTVTYGDALPAITGVAKDGDTVVAGVFTLVAGQKLTVANANYNYTFVPTDTAKYSTVTGATTITVVAKALTITGVTAQYKSYDGTCDVILENGTLTGIVSPDVVTLQLGKGTAVNKNAGASVSVTYTPSLLGADKDNYVISSKNDVTVEVAQRMVMITGVIATERPYDGTNNITISGGIIGDGMLSGDQLGVELGQGTSLYAECGHDIDNVVSYKNAKLTLADAGNYVIDEGLSIKPLAKITKREIAVVWPVVTLSYKGKTHDLLADFNFENDLTADSGIIGESIGFKDVTCDALLVAAVGTYTFTAHLLSDRNFVISVASATKEYQVIESNLSKAEHYIATVDAIGTVVYTQECLVKIVAAETEYATLTSPVTTMGNVPHRHSVAVAARTEYDRLAKEVKSISVTTLPAKITYFVGEAFSATSGKLTVTKADNTTEIIDLTEAMCGAVDTATAGTVTVTVTYETKTATFDITVNQIAPTIATAPTASGTVTYGDALPAITGVAKDGNTVVAGVFTLVAGQKLTVANANYNYTFAPTDTAKYTTVTGATTITVVAKALTITGVTATNRVYDGTTVVALTGGKLNDAIVADNMSFTLSNVSIENANVGNGKKVTYTATLIGDAKANYTVTSNDVSVNITKATYNMTGVTFEGASKVYNGDVQTLAIGGTSLPKGVSVSYSVGKKDVGSQVITATFAGDATNYNAITSKTATITITAKSIAVVWGATQLPYTSGAIAPTASVATGVAGDTIALTVTGKQTLIGNNYTARVAMTTPNANYTLTNTTVAFTIVESEVSIAEALAAAKVAEINDLNTAKATYKQSNYSVNDWNTITGYYDTAVAGINAVTVITNLPGNFVTTFTTNANLVKTIDQEAATIYDFTLIDSGAAYSLKKKAGVTLSANLTIPSAYGGIPVTTIDYKAFNGCKDLTTVNIPNSVTSIGKQAFFNCSNIAKITVPNSVTSIGKWAFDGTAWIKGKSEGVLYVNNVAYVYVGVMPANTSIELTAGTVSISPAAFDRCTGLVSIIIPGSVKNIGNDAFNGCNSLTTITMQNGVASIEGRAFNGCTALTSINLPASVTNIVDNPFMNCINLNTITVDSGNATYKSAGNCVIKSASKTLIIGCKSSVIPIDNSVTSIGTSAFDGCANLASITIPSNVTSIGDYAFQSCTGLTTIDIPNSVVTIGKEAFVICSRLSAVTIGSGVTSIGPDAFYNCSSLTSITVDPANTAYASYKGVLTNKAKTEIIATPQSMNSDIKKEAQYIVSVNAIGTVAVTPECLAKIVAAENAYSTLSANVKSDEAVISAHATAVAARTEYDRLAATGV